MNRYTIQINLSNDDEPYLFYLFSEESKEYVEAVITAAQDEYHFDSPCDLMDYVCDTYGFTWEDFDFDVEISMEV